MPNQESQDLVDQELRDERARRREAERRLEELTDRAELWRGRAEERAERIDRLLEAERRKGSTLRRWLKALTRQHEAQNDQGTATPPQAQLEKTPEPAHPWPSMRSVVVASLVSDPAKGRALAMFDQRRAEQIDDSVLDRADLVVIEPAAIREVSAEKRNLLESWSARSARQPLVVWTGNADISAVARLLSPSDLVVASGLELATEIGAQHLPGCFNPEVHNPMRVDPRRQAATPRLDQSTFDDPNLELLESAASGGDRSAAATAARRWAYREHSPWVRAAQLLELARIGAPSPIPAIAAIVVSHRPADVPSAVEAMLRQTHRSIEVIIGLHGAKPTPEIEDVASRADAPVEVLTFDGNHTLGECLNLAASHTSAPLIAKIDDDDHYGPGYLEDSFHSLAYSRADVVGKGAHFTYLSNRDTTVLRRPGQEEMLIDGSPNGATLVLKRAAWEETGFPHRPRHVDTGFLRATRSLGAQVYVGSRWEFCYVRNPEGHTWDAEDEVFLAGSEPAWSGFQPGRVEVPDVGSH